MFKKIYIIALAVVVIAGCKKDPKNVGPTNSFSTSTYPKTVNDLQTVLVSAYANLRDPGLFGFWFMPKALSNSMHTVNSVYNGDPAWNEMANTNLTAGNNYAGARDDYVYIYSHDADSAYVPADRMVLARVPKGQLKRRDAHEFFQGLDAKQQPIWTKDIGKAHRLARAMRAGTVWINCYNIFDAALPFGGYKQSGWGREMGKEALELYTEVKSVCVAI